MGAKLTDWYCGTHRDRPLPRWWLGGPLKEDGWATRGCWRQTRPRRGRGPRLPPPGTSCPTRGASEWRGPCETRLCDCGRPCHLIHLDIESLNLNHRRHCHQEGIDK